MFQISHLVKEFNSVPAVNDVTTKIDRGEVVFIVGPSGSGKSTFLRCLNLLEEPTSGEIRFKGKLITSPGTDVNQFRQHVGMVFQQPNPFPQSLYDNVAFGPRLQGIKKASELDEIVEKSLTQASLWNEVKDRLHKSAISLSGGQQQRLCIARTLAIRPDVILMDEPTSALDPISTAKIEELALELKEDYTIVIVTHNMQQAARISDKTAFFLMGDLVEYNKTKTIFTEPTQPKTADYINGRFG